MTEEMTRIKKYNEETILYAKRVPKSKLVDVSTMVENYLKRFMISPLSKNSVEMPLRPEECFEATDDVFLDKAKKMVPVTPETVGDRLVSIVDKVNVAELKVMQKKALKEKTTKNSIEKAVIQNGIIYYPCGCFNDGFLRGAKGCKIGNSNAHKEKFGL